MNDRDERGPNPPKVVMLSLEEVRFLDDGELEQVLGGQTGPGSAVCNACTNAYNNTCCGTDAGRGGGGGGDTGGPGCYLL